MSIYSDQYTIFRSPKEATLSMEQELAGEIPPLSQFGHVLQELGITRIKALTPQAKGRIERLFETLQDRWVVELRLRHIHTIEEANRVLPVFIRKHNQLFAVKPVDPESAYVLLNEGQDLECIVCYREKRTVGSGETVSYGGRTYKIATKNAKPTIPVKTRVEVRETLNGERFIWYKGKNTRWKKSRSRIAKDLLKKKRRALREALTSPLPIILGDNTTNPIGEDTTTGLKRL